MFSLLLDHGCDPLACDHLGATLLHYAASGGNLAIIRRLLTLGCDKDAVTQYGRTVLHYAAFSKQCLHNKMPHLVADVDLNPLKDSQLPSKRLPREPTFIAIE